MAVRIAAAGFVHPAIKGADAYIWSGWNILDMIVVVTSCMNVVLNFIADIDALQISALRALRILRALKSIRFFRDVQAILLTLVHSVRDSASILLFLGFIFIVAGVVGVQLFKGMLHFRCSATAPQPDATGYDWAPGLGLGIHHTQCLPDGFPEAMSNLCPDTVCPPGARYGASPFGVPQLANSSEEGCPQCFASSSCAAGEMCWEFGNLGFSYVGFDNIFMAWATLCTMMAQLYWWETAYRIESAAQNSAPVVAALAWPVCFVVVITLSFFAVNIFVAIVTQVFAQTREEAAKEHVYHIAHQPKALIHIRHRTRPPPVPDVSVLLNFKGDESVGELMEQVEKDFGVPTNKYKLYWGELTEVVDTSRYATQGSKQLVEGHNIRGFPSKQLLPEEDVAGYLQQVWVANAARRGQEQQRHLKKLKWKEPWKVQVRVVDKASRAGGPPVYRTETRWVELRRPPPWYRLRAMHKFVTSTAFEYTVLLMIVANTVVLIFDNPLLSDKEKPIQVHSEVLFATFFVLEAGCKILGRGFSNYIWDPLNALDWAIVVLSIARLVFSVLPGTNVARIVRLVSSSSSSVHRIRRALTAAKLGRLLLMHRQLAGLMSTVLSGGKTIANIILIILFFVSTHVPANLYILQEY